MIDFLSQRVSSRSPLLAGVPLYLLLLGSPGRAAAQRKGDADAEAPVHQVLDGQVAAWNRGDLEGYMAGYLRSPELTFYSGGTITQGWQPTLDRYRKRYQGEGHQMGQLAFADVRVDLLSADWAVVRGRWSLRKSQEKEQRGLFTVVMKKLPEGWRIIHDHSSAE